MTKPYPPFSGLATTCPKCQATSTEGYPHRMTYRRAGTIWPGPGSDTITCNDAMRGEWPEWMHRTCNLCHYDWPEQCP